FGALAAAGGRGHFSRVRGLPQSDAPLTYDAQSGFETVGAGGGKGCQFAEAVAEQKVGADAGVEEDAGGQAIREIDGELVEIGAELKGGLRVGGGGSRGHREEVAAEDAARGVVRLAEFGLKRKVFVQLPQNGASECTLARERKDKFVRSILWHM